MVEPGLLLLYGKWLFTCLKWFGKFDIFVGLHFLPGIKVQKVIEGTSSGDACKN